MPLAAKVSVLPFLWGIKQYQAPNVLGCEAQKLIVSYQEIKSGDLEIEWRYGAE